MRITFRQSGGYTGLQTGCEIDTNTLPPQEAAELRSRVEQSKLLQTQSTRSSNARDLTNYDITLEMDGQAYQISLDDFSLTEGIIPLLNYLQDRAHPV